MQGKLEDRQKFWNDFAPSYGMLETAGLPSLITLGNMLQIQRSQKILEVGSATGELTFHFLKTLKHAQSYTSIDFSQIMNDIAARKKSETFGLNPLIQHKFITGDAEDLSFIEDESFDTYISGMCLHTVSDPNKMVKEAMRLLTKGGRIGVTALVTVEKNFLMSLFMKKFEEFGVKLPTLAISERDQLISMFKDHGFEVDFVWLDKIVFPGFGEEDMDALLDSFIIRKFYHSHDEETRKRIRVSILREFEENYKKPMLPLEVEIMSVVGRKPLLLFNGF
jgi:ubiquinone/menaquinone biosynthesis C-methylase UbiE